MGECFACSLLLVQVPMVGGAQQGEVVEVRRAAVYPVADVVGVAAAGWGLAAAHGAAAITGHQRASLGGGNQSTISAGSEDLPGLAAEGGRQVVELAA